MSKAELTPSSLYTRLSISVDGPFVHLVTQFFPELCFILHPAVILPFLKCNSHISAYLQLSNGFPLPLGFSPSLLKGLLKPHMTSPRLPLRYHLLPLSHLSIHSVNMYGVLLTLGFPGGSDGKASACNAGDPGSIPGSGRSPGEGNGNPLQHSCLEDPMNRGT